MKDLLLEKNAFITGATRGIGKAIAKTFVEQGASVAFCGTNEERGKQVEQELRSVASPHQKVRFYLLDLSQRGIESHIEKLVADFGPIEILVNNAGITRDRLFIKMSEEDWEKVLFMNLQTVFHVCKVLARPMMKARKGKIINITSVVGITGNAGQANYAASKAGLIGFTKSLAKEMGSRNLCVNCIAPGFIKTDMTEKLPETIKSSLLEQIPFKSWGQPEDVAHAALFLASPLSDYITGQVLVVDGGMVT